MFFFQAEDGIRDIGVTGVQTCALPICLRKVVRDEAVGEALELLALLYRDAAVVAAGAPELAANADRAEEIEACVREHSRADWAGAARIFEEAKGELAYNVSPEAILEVALSRTRQKILGTSPDS